SQTHGVALKKGVLTDDDAAYEEVQITDTDPIPLDAEILDLSKPGAMAAFGGNDGASEINIDQSVTPKRSPLPKAPVAGMSQPGPNGPLPIIASDGRTPMQVYARPFSNPGAKPMVALLVGGLGLNSKTTNAAIETLPPEVTLSFVPYAKDLQTWINHARAYGHEVMIEAPLEPFDYPDNDTGPQTLLSTAKPDENAKKLNWLMGRAQGYFGMVNYQGGKFASSPAASAQLMNALNERGLAFVQDGSASRSAFANAARAAQTPFAAADRVVDSQPAAASIDEQLLTLEALALQNGASLGAGFGYPSTIEKAATWAQGLASKGYALAPVSAVVKARAQH
ncbi:MAG: divergent polysaccharide deacetylase family protein, partial [Caulobacterales bacterium]